MLNISFDSKALLLFLLPVVTVGQGRLPVPPMSETAFKNVQVLKGIPVDEFMDTMGMFAAALTLNCVDCHVANATPGWDSFATDTPLKRTARRMVLMVNKLNQENLGAHDS